jgi:TRAP-type C4-dicarboxylate transport system permease large subunit
MRGVVEMLDLMGIGIFSLVMYIVIILVLMMIFKRKASESMLWSYLVLVIVGGIHSKAGIAKVFTTSFKVGITSEVVYAAMGFVFMSFIMQKTGVIMRLVNILNSVIGRLPGGSGYVSTMGSALFGMVSGSGSGNAAAIGSITIPWMMKTGWSQERATLICAGNAGMGMIFPPSTSMLLLLGMDSIANELPSGTLYVGLLGAAFIVLLYRLGVIFYFAKKDGLKPVPEDEIMPFSQALKENGSSLLIFLGVIIPLLATMGPTGAWVKAALNAGIKTGFKSISIVFWIPIVMSFFTIVEGWKFLPHNAGGWNKLIKGSIDKYSDVGMLLFTAFAASNVLNHLGMTNEVKAVFTHMGNYSSTLVVVVIAILITMMVGPFSGTATTSALGAAVYAALRAIGLPPVICCVAFLNLISNEGAIPPNAAPLYIASGISGLEDPSRIFKPILLYFVLPTAFIAVLIMLKIIPVIGA